MSITRTAWTDDSGSGLDGTIINNAEKTALYDQIDGRWSELTTTLTGTQDNFSITSGGLEADVLRCNNASLLTLTGIVAPASPAKPGKKLIIYSVGAGRVDLPHQNGGSSAANQFFNKATSAASSLAPGKGVAMYVYDDTIDRWRMAFLDQGAAITPTFAAGTYTGSASMTWTVASGDASSGLNGYWLRDKWLTVSWDLRSTTVGGTPSTDLQIGSAAWGGFNSAFAQWGTHTYSDNGTRAAGRAFVIATGGNIFLNLANFAGNWAASTDATDVFGTMTFEVI